MAPPFDSTQVTDALASACAETSIVGLGSYIRTATAKPQARAELAYRIKTLREHDIAVPWNSPSRS